MTLKTIIEILRGRPTLKRSIAEAFATPPYPRKNQTREFLVEYVAMNPARTSVRNGLVPRLTGKTALGELLFTRTSYSPRPMSFIIAALILALSGGTAVAAEGSLPGDTLYPVKIHVNESVRTALALSAEADANWDVERAERRLEEAAELAARNTLNEATRTEIEMRLERHIQDAEDTIQSLNQGGSSSGTEASTKLRAVLAAHEQVLRTIRNNTSDETTRTEIDRALTSLTEHLSTARHLEDETDDDSSNDAEHRSEQSTQSAADGQRTAAAAKIASVERAFAQLASTTATTTSSYSIARTRITDAKNAFAAGDAAMSVGSTTQAFAHFRSALKLAIDAQEYLSASRHEDGYHASSQHDSDESSDDHGNRNGSERSEGSISDDDDDNDHILKIESGTTTVRIEDDEDESDNRGRGSSNR